MRFGCADLLGYSGEVMTLTDAQWNQLGEILAKRGLCIRKEDETSYVIADTDNRRVSEEVYTEYSDAFNALVNGTYTPLTVRVDTCVQHGAKNKPQWAKAKAQPVTQL